MMQWILIPPVYNYCEEVIFESDLRWYLVVL